MPSSSNYKRNYKHEDSLDSPQRKKYRAERDKARRLLEKKLGHKIPEGMDVDHIHALSQDGKNKISNLRIESAHKNRSYARNSDGSIKKDTAHK